MKNWLLKSKMKNKVYSLVLPLVLACFNAQAQHKIQPYVDERVELMSSIFRLIDAREYSDNNNKLYVEDIQKAFGNYKNQDFLNSVKELRNNDGIGYDAVMAIAVRLELKNGGVKLSNENTQTLDKRWNKEKVSEFMKGLNQYYKTSKFHQFYESHEKDYQQAAKAFSDSVLVKFNQDWYNQFYGKQPNEEYKVFIGYGNGGGNYGPRVSKKSGKDIVYAIVSGGDFNGRQLTYSSDYAPTLIHEFNHSFVNYILETKDYKKELEVAGKQILEAVKKPMAEQAYTNWETIINESLVRAAVIIYMKENQFSEKAIKEEYKDQRNRQFLWMPELVELLEEYQKNRKQYSSLETFYPNIVAFFQKTGGNINTIVNDFEAKKPKVKSLSPDINGKIDVDSSLKTMVVEFDKPLTGKRMSIHWGSLGKQAVPISSRPIFINDNNAIKLELKMEPNKEYEFILTGNGFESVDGYPLQEYTVKFKTK